MIETTVSHAPGRTLKITSLYLDEKLACNEQVDTFHGLFPEGVELASEELVLEHINTFDWLWAMDRILEGDLRRRALRNEEWIHELRHNAQTTYWREFDSLPARAHAERALHTEKLKQARMEYYRRAALIFARAFIEQGGRLLMEGEQA